MALLSLLLAGNEEAWRKPELHALRDKHSFVGDKKLLELHIHMIGKRGIESAIFASYVSFVERAHPGATLAALFADEELFDDARRLLEELGAQAFFAKMNAGVGDAAEGWGDLARVDAWDRARFDAAARGSDPTEREALFSALAKSWSKAADSVGTYVALGMRQRGRKDIASALGFVWRDPDIGGENVDALWTAYARGNAEAGAALARYNEDDVRALAVVWTGCAANEVGRALR